MTINFFLIAGEDGGERETERWGVCVCWQKVYCGSGCGGITVGPRFEISLLPLKPPDPQELAHTRQTSSADEACT